MSDIGRRIGVSVTNILEDEERFACRGLDVVAGMTFHGSVAAAAAGAVVDPVFDGVDCPCGPSAASHDVVDVWFGEHALLPVALDGSVFESGVFGEAADA